MHKVAREERWEGPEKQLIPKHLTLPKHLSFGEDYENYRIYCLG